MLTDSVTGIVPVILVGSKNPTGHAKKPGGGDFWKTLFARASAWTWSQQDRELITLEMFCRPGLFW
jgi:hypothetical protein